MTQERSVELGCPKCNEKQSITLYESINVSLDPSLKEKLFRGEINLFIPVRGLQRKSLRSVASPLP
jgi:hypothetical protein